MRCVNWKERFVHYVIAIIVVWNTFNQLLIIFLLEQLFGLLAPCTKVVFIKYYEIPVYQVNELVVGFDCSSFLIDAKKVLE